MIRRPALWFNDRFPRTRRWINRWWYEWVSRQDRRGQLVFMNYGYACDEVDALELEAADSADRSCIGLYARTVDTVSLTGRDVLEVGCGRGGGASWLTRTHRPRSYLGVDVTRQAVAFCTAHHRTEGLSFQLGEAAALPLADESVDVIVNVESSHCYPSTRRFLAEVRRVLRPGGDLAYADFRLRGEVPAWEAELAGCGLDVVSSEDLTAGVLRALDQDDPRKRALIRRHIPWLVRKPFREFAAMRGSEMFYGAFAAGLRVYRRYLLRKPVGEP